MQYFVVMCNYGDNGLEAIVDPALTRDQIIARIKTREYDNIVQIDWVVGSVALDVTTELIDAAEAELIDDGGPDEPLPAAVIPPVCRHGS